MNPMCKPLLRQFAFLMVAALFTAAVAAQSAHSPSESSSTDYLVSPDGSFGGAAAAGGASHHNYASNSNWSDKIAFEAGGGFSAPSSDSSPYITWGGGVTLGGGLHLNRYVTMLAEYQFLDNKLPGALIAETGANGGYAHTWSLTLAPVVDLLPKRTNSVYVTGGGGFYRKVTSFTDPEETEYCSYYYCGIGTTNAVVGHFSSNQGGWNFGAGITHKIGGKDAKMKLFAEARYLNVDTPAVTTQPNGLGTTSVAANTKLIPVSFGIRF